MGKVVGKNDNYEQSSHLTSSAIPKFAASMSQSAVSPQQQQSAIKGKLTSSFMDHMGHSQEDGDAIPCVQCKEPVYFGDVAVAIPHINPDLVWHPNCFICSICGVSFSFFSICTVQYIYSWCHIHQMKLKKFIKYVVALFSPQ